VPWTPKDAESHTKAAKTPGLKKRWSAIANAVLQKTGDEAMAIRTANARMHGVGDRLYEEKK